jgi:hypothetical protein
VAEPPPAVPARVVPPWVLVMMVASCLLAVAASSLAAYLAMAQVRQAQTLQQRHEDFCEFLSTEVDAASAPVLRPLVPALRAEHAKTGC